MNDFKSYRVNNFYQEFLHPDTLIRADYNGIVWTLTIGFPGITAEEVSQLQYGDMRASFTVIHNSLFLFTKIGAFEWFDIPYEPRLNLPSDPNNFYPAFEEGKGASLALLICDTSCGKLCGLRIMSLGNRLSNNLNEVCREMCREGAVTPEENTRRVEAVYGEYPSAKDMIETVDIGNIFLLMKKGMSL